MNLRLSLSRAELQVDTTELLRGLVIGNFERLIVFAEAVQSNLQALAFLMAAKGLIRIKQLEDRDYADYFLIGTLSSIALALASGLLAAAMINTYW